MGTNAADLAADQPANHAAPSEAGGVDPLGTAGQLLVFAHGDEASAFTDVPHLVTGVGKVDAATVLGKALADAREAGQPIRRVVVLGTAGIISDDHDLDTVVQITGAVQHDINVSKPRIAIEPSVLDKTATIATGDQFVTSDQQRIEIAALGASLVDMEIYAYAAVCKAYGVPLYVFKIPSDFADSSTTDQEWDEIVFLKSRQLREFFNSELPRLLGD